MGIYKFYETNLKDSYELITKPFIDERGKLVKLYHAESLHEQGLNAYFEESYYSVSERGVLRGFHFQLPPASHIKLVGCIEGVILDVIVDLRKGSETYGKTFSTELDSKKANLLYVPEGFAHGFLTLSEKSVFISYNSKRYNSELEAGIKWDSVEFKWPISNPVLSQKDRNLIAIDEYKSVF